MKNKEYCVGTLCDVILACRSECSSLYVVGHSSSGRHDSNVENICWCKLYYFFFFSCRSNWMMQLCDLVSRKLRREIPSISFDIHCWIILPIGYLLAHRLNWLHCLRVCWDATPRIEWNLTIFSIILSYANLKHNPLLRRCPSQIWRAFQHLQRHRRSQSLLGPWRRLQLLKTTTQRRLKKLTISFWYRAQANCVVVGLGVWP